MGGQVDKESRATVGRLPAIVLAELSIDVAFLSTTSWDLQRGITIPSKSKVEAKKAAARAAIGPCWSRRARECGPLRRCRVLGLDAVRAVITDTGLDGDIGSAVERETETQWTGSSPPADPQRSATQRTATRSRESAVGLDRGRARPPSGRAGPPGGATRVDHAGRASRLVTAPIGGPSVGIQAAVPLTASAICRLAAPSCGPCAGESASKPHTGKHPSSVHVSCSACW